MFEYLGVSGGVILVSSYIPQILKMVRTKSADDISIPFIGLIGIGAFCLALYAYHIEDLLFFVLNIISSLIALVVLVLAYYYQNKSIKKEA